MIRIFTASKSEYEEMVNMVSKWQVHNNESEYDIFVNPPRDSIAVVAWSVDDIIQALGEKDIDTEEIPEELLIEIIEELGLNWKFYSRRGPKRVPLLLRTGTT